MKVLVCGSRGCIGRAVVVALRTRDHEVVEGARGLAEGRRTMPIDFMAPGTPNGWARRLAALHIDAIVNCAGILVPQRGQTFERVHAQGPIELFLGAALAGVKRVVQVSALGVGGDPEAVAMPYLFTKLKADEVLAALPLEWAVVRPSLVAGPGSQSAALFATLASLPVIALPGRGGQRVQPVHVYELAEAIARLVEQPEAPNRIVEIGGGAAISYREMLATYRQALGVAEPIWCRVPMPLMLLGAWAAEALPQRVFCRDTLRLLERGSVPAANGAAGVLGRPPVDLAQGLAVTPPVPLLDLRVQLSPALALLLRSALAAMWIVTALISALMPHRSGVLDLLARCGFEGRAGLVALVLSCTLNLTLGAWLLLRPTPWVHALQAGAISGYTLVAAWSMPELMVDHCGPLLKNLPVLAAVLLLWLAQPADVSASRTVRAGIGGSAANRAFAGRIIAPR